MRWVRTWLPLAIIVAGFVMMAATGWSEDGIVGGAGMVGAGLSVWLLNLFFRVGVKGDLERDAEDRARDFYDEHGFWPDEAPPDEPAPPPPRPSGPGHHRDRPRRRPQRPPRRPHRHEP
jgi:hypothetical protein